MKPRTLSVAKENRLKSHNDIFQSIQKYNPTLKNILKVEQIFVKHKEFDSKVQLAKKLDITMRPPVLNVILKYLERSNKIVIDDDGSLVWIYASSKAKRSLDKAVRL